MGLGSTKIPDPFNAVFTGGGARDVGVFAKILLRTVVNAIVVCAVVVVVANSCDVA